MAPSTRQQSRIPDGDASDGHLQTGGEQQETEREPEGLEDPKDVTDDVDVSESERGPIEDESETPIDQGRTSRVADAKLEPGSTQLIRMLVEEARKTAALEARLVALEAWKEPSYTKAPEAPKYPVDKLPYLCSLEDVN